jgi:hypothetical protein
MIFSGVNGRICPTLRPGFCADFLRRDFMQSSKNTTLDSTPFGANQQIMLCGNAHQTRTTGAYLLVNDSRFLQIGNYQMS